MNLKLAITICVSLFTLTLFAQKNEEPCGTDRLMQELLQTDPAAAKRLSELEKNIAAYQDGPAADASRSIVVRIPVVFHVIHTGQAIGTGSNILEAQILSQVEVLNACFRKRNADTAMIPSWFKSRAADFQVEFCMAQYNASGNITSGINRYEYTNISDLNYFDNVIKPATQWNPDMYLNIWVTVLNSPLLGYATFPCLFPRNQDGVVLDYRVVGKAPANPFTGNKNLGKTGVHEVGHWLGLYHNFEGGCADTLSQNCNILGDYVCDTPPEKEATYGKPNLLQNTCNEEPVDERDMWMNYMDYPDDDQLWMFTQGQKERVRAVLNNCRLAIQSSLGCTNVANVFSYSGQVLNQANNAGVPNAKLLFDGPMKFEVSTDGAGNFSIPSLVEGYYDLYAGAWGYYTQLDTVHALFSPSSAPRTIRLRGGRYYDDFLFDYNWNKSNTANSGFWVREKPTGTFFAGEPANPTDDLPDDFGMTCYVTGNGSGNPLTGGVINGTTSLISPSFDATTFTDPCIRYARWYYNGGSAPSGDNMLVRLSDGGNNMTLETIDTSQRPTNRWTTKVIRIADFVQPGNNMRVIFVVNDVPGSSQNIVEAGLDRFEVLECNAVSAEEIRHQATAIIARLYPNPSTGKVIVEYTQQHAVPLMLKAHNILGEELFRKDLENRNAGTEEIDFSSYPDGLYFVTVRSPVSEKIIKFSLQR